MKTRYPTFDPSDNVVLKGSLLNQVLRDLERLSRLQFSRDFQVIDSPAGMIVSVNFPPGAKTLKIISFETAGGIYKCQVVQGFPFIDPAVNSAIPQFNESLSPEVDCYLENAPELNVTNSHWLAVGSKVVAIPSGCTATDNLTIYRIYIPPVDEWGTLTTSWVPGNNFATLQPCTSSTDNTALSVPTVTVNLQYPISSVPDWCGFVVGDIVGFRGTGDGHYVAIDNPPPFVMNQYAGLFNNSSDPTKPNVIPDYMRAF